MSGNREKKKRASILSAVVVITILAVFVGFILFPLFNEMAGMLFAAMLLLLYAVGILAVIIGVIAALSQRLRELDNGEEEEARKY